MLNNFPSEVLKENSSKSLQKVRIMPNHNIIHSIDKLKNKNNKGIKTKLYKNSNSNTKKYNNKIQQYIEYEKNYKKHKKANTPKTPLLTSKQSLHTMKYYENNYDRKSKGNNMFIKNNKNNNIIKSYISPAFDYNIKSNINNRNNIHLDLKNNYSKPIKLQDDSRIEDYKNMHTNKKNQRLNSSIDWKSSSLYETNSHTGRTLQNNHHMKLKNSKKKNNSCYYEMKGNNNNNKEIKKYLSSTPDCVRKAPFVKNRTGYKVNNYRVSDQDIKEIFEKEFNEKMILGLKTKKNSYYNNSSLITSSSRNRTDDLNVLENSHNYSQKNLIKYDNGYIKRNNVYRTINVEEHHKNHKSKNGYEKYYSLLEGKIKILNNEIQDIRDEEKSLLLQLIDYKEKEKECNYIRQLRNEINRYKTVIEKTSKACEEYSNEINRIKNILGQTEIDKDMENNVYNSNVNNNI